MLIEESGIEHVRRIMAAAAGEPFQGDLEPHILRSWSRCVGSYGLNPDHLPDIAVVDRASLELRRNGLREVMEIADVELQRLYQQIAGSGFAVLLTDSEGVILKRVTDPSLERGFSHSGLIDGASWREQHTGTNGMGTCLAEGEPVTVHRGDHFCTGYSGLTCSAAPINDPSGSLIAVLDASSASSMDSRASQLHTMALVKMSATLIENYLFLRQYRAAWVLRFQTRPEFVGILGEAMLAVAHDGRVLAANAGAVTLLHRQSRQELVGSPLDSLFDLGLEALRDRCLRSGSTLWPMRELASGNGYFAIARGPECLPSRSLLGLKRRPAPVFHRSPGDPGLSLREVIGRDPVMNRNAEAARRLIDSDVPFLLSGESGVGKASFARALHRESKRSERSLVVVNCVTLSEQHGETELFGCRGLAAGGPIGCRGHIAQAHGGTLYLDEVGKLPSSLQTRLLRVLEDRELVPVGGERPLPMDVQVIASSRAVLKELVSRGTLCEDLYYRLDGATLELPALRERVDIKELIDAIVDLENSTERPLVVEPAAMTRLLEYDWPGNLRQLRAVMRRAVALCVDSRIRLGDLPATLGGTERPEWTPVPAAAAARLPGAGFAVGASGRLEEAERMALLRELELRRWNVTTTAAALSISRNTLYRRMKRLGIPPSQRLLKELN